MTISLVLLCTTFYQNNKITESVNSFNETFGNKTYYFMYEALDDKDYYTYLDDDNTKDYKKLLNFTKSLYKQENFNFISLNSQFIDIYGREIPDMFLYSYEDGTPKDSIYEDKGKTYYSTKAIQVSSSFFKEFDIKITQGSGFDENDYINKNKKIPVILGNAYKDYFSIGDTFKCIYLFENTTCEIIGFIDKNSFFYENDDENFISCERYIVMPSMYTETNSPSLFDKTLLLQHTNGIITCDKGNETINKDFFDLIKNCKLSKWDFYITSTYDKKVQAMNNTIETYSAMTLEVSNHFKSILVILLIFAVISLTISICGFVREQHYNYGINLLCGASYFDISANISILTGILIMISAALTTFILFIFSYKYLLGLLLIYLLSFGIWIFITFVTILYLKSMNLQDIIGGKE